MIINQNILLTVDCVVFNGAGELLVIRRRDEPYAGKYALPGGLVEHAETVEDAVRRELKEETGVEAKSVRLVGVYSDPNRDPRGHYVSVAFLVELSEGQEAHAGDDAAAAGFVKDWESLDFAFDHRTILEDALKIR